MNQPVTGLITEPPVSAKSIQRRLNDLGFLTVSEFQEFYGDQLKVDGKAGPKTQRLLFGRRMCGCPDRVTGPQGELCKWPMPDITFAFEDSYTRSFPSLTAEKVVAGVDKALKGWNNVCGTKLRRIDTKLFHEANIYAVAVRMDGPGGVLADSFLPCGVGQNGRLRQRFDITERWGFDDFTGVTGHEVGHAIGIGHLSDPESLMNAFYNGTILPRESDAREGRKRYGPPVEEPEEPDEPPQPPTERFRSEGSITITCPHGSTWTAGLFEKLGG